MPETLKNVVIANPPQGDAAPRDAANGGPARTPAGQRAEEPPRPQPVALEVPVTVNGVRAAEGTNKREPFSETTRTVLIFASGAVIRLSSAVAPGQLLFLSNENTKKEVVCQVVKSKNYKNVSGYVELEFTEPAVGFWGMRFPSDRVAAQAAPALKPMVPQAASSMPPAAGIPQAGEARPVSAAPKETVTHTPEKKTDAPSGTAGILRSLVTGPKGSASAPPAPIEASLPKPPVGEFAQQLAELAGQLSAANTKKFEQVQPVASAGGDSHRCPVAESAPIADNRHSSAAEILSPPPEKEARSVGSLLEGEGLPVPSWFDPAARGRAATPSQDAVLPPPPPPPPVVDAKLTLLAEETAAPEEPETGPALPMAVAEPTPDTTAQEAPVFRSALLLETPEESVESLPTKSGRGLAFGAIAAVLTLAAAGGAWYFWKAAPAPAQRTVTAPVPPPSTPAPMPAQKPPETTGAVNPNPAAVTSVAATVPSKPASSLAKPPASSLQEAARSELKSIEKPAPEKQAGKKPAPPEIRLASPVASRKAMPSASVQADMNLGVGVAAPPGAGDFSADSLVGSGTSQPEAPQADVPTGGNVKPARLISSTPPVYPTMARNLRVAGDVVIDALIETSGRITSMKVVSGPVALHQAAIDAVRQWKYAPATLNGKPVAMHMTVTVRFRLQ